MVNGEDAHAEVPGQRFGPRPAAVVTTGAQLLQEGEQRSVRFMEAG